MDTDRTWPTLSDDQWVGIHDNIKHLFDLRATDRTTLFSYRRARYAAYGSIACRFAYLSYLQSSATTSCSRAAHNIAQQPVASQSVPSPSTPTSSAVTA